MSDYKCEKRSHWVEELETNEHVTQLPYHLAAWDSLKRKPPPANSVTAEQMEPANWLAEVERRRQIFQEEKSRLAAAEEQKLLEKEQARVLPSEKFNQMGVRLSILLKIIKDFGGTSAFEGLSCRKVAENIKEFCKYAKVSSYTHYLEGIESKMVGKATVYVAYASHSKYLDLVSTLEEHLKQDQVEGKETYLWLDLFCRDLGREPNYDRTWFTRTFPDNLRDIGSLVLVYDFCLNQNQSVECNPLNRTWICYELHTCFEQGVRFEVVMPEKERQQFRLECVDSASPPQLLRFTPRIDIADTTTSTPSDYRAIVAYFEDRYYLDEVNCLIKDLMRAWLVRGVVDALTHHAEFQDAADMLQGVVRNARRYRENRQLDIAMVLLEGCAEYSAMPIASGDSVTDTSALEAVFLGMFDDSYCHEDSNPGALEYFNQVLALKQRLLPMEHVSIANTLTHLGCVLTRTGLAEDEEKAILAYRSAIKIRLDVLGETHPALAAGYYGLAGVFKARGDRVNAEVLAGLSSAHVHTELIRKQTRELGQTQDERENQPLVCDYYHCVKYLNHAVEIQKEVVKAQAHSVNSGDREQLTLAGFYRLLASVHDKLCDSYAANKYCSQARKIRDTAVASFERDSTFDLKLSLAMGGGGEETKEDEKDKNKSDYDRDFDTDADDKDAEDYHYQHEYQDKCYEAGAVSYAAGELHESSQHFKRALQAARRRFKEIKGVHPVVATACTNLALVYSAQGDRQAALRYTERALEIRQQCLGEDHLDTGASYNSLGLLYEEVAEAGREIVLQDSRSGDGDDGGVLTPVDAKMKAEACYHAAGETRLRSRTRSRSRSRSRSRGAQEGSNRESKPDWRPGGRGRSPGRGKPGSLYSSSSSVSSVSDTKESIASPYYQDRVSSPQKADRVEKMHLTRYIEAKEGE